MCPLCGARAADYFYDERTRKSYKICPRCALRFLDASHHLSPDDERDRYDLHKNDLTDSGYLEYVKPLVDIILAYKTPPAHGLDYGSGPVPVMSHLLTARGYAMERFDPYFGSCRQALEKKYDFIVASEVAEHFYQPRKEFEFLRARLRPGGALGLLTSLFDPSINFAGWHYRRDPTHVCFYSRPTFEWMRRNLGFSTLRIVEPRTILLSRE